MTLMISVSHKRKFGAQLSTSLLLLLLLGGRAIGQQEAPAANANDLVAEVVQKELKAADSAARFMYRLRRETPAGSQTKELVETKDGIVARLIAVNDKPLTPEQRAQDDRRLEYLLSHPQEQQRKKREQQQDADRVARMFKALPDAFLYRADGTEPGKNGRLIRLTFRPNPDYDPPSREMSVFRGMDGKMWVDEKTHRLARIEGTLFRDVNFGWGILGHLDRGGHFIVAQSDVGDGHWEATHLDIEFNGKALLFKTINLKQKETSSDYRRVPELSLAQAIELLKKNGSVVAENQAARPEK
jgi:hypothetical protein